MRDSMEERVEGRSASERAFREMADRMWIEDWKRRHPRAPCYTCQFYRRMDLVDGVYVFVLPNTPDKLADRDTIHAWCIIEVLDRCPDPLYGGKACPYWEDRKEPATITAETLALLHPLRRSER